MSTRIGPVCDILGTSFVTMHYFGILRVRPASSRPCVYSVVGWFSWSCLRTWQWPQKRKNRCDHRCLVDNQRYRDLIRPLPRRRSTSVSARRRILPYDTARLVVERISLPKSRSPQHWKSFLQCRCVCVCWTAAWFSEQPSGATEVVKRVYTLGKHEAL